MARQPRLDIPGGLYHVMVRGIERRSIFNDDADRKEFLARFEQSMGKTVCRCYAWALMSNHVHLLLRAGTLPLSHTMRRLLTGYAIYFNRRHRRSGYLFQNRYKSILCQDDVYFLQLVRYIHLNPVRAGLVADLGQLARYPWAGHGVILGKRKAPWQETGEVLSHFSKHRDLALKAYGTFMGDSEALKEHPQLLGGGLKRSAGGWSGVFALRREQTPWAYDSRILGDGDFVSDALKRDEQEFNEEARFKKEGWGINKLVEHVCATVGLDPGLIKKKGRQNNISRCRGLVAYIGRRKMGLPAQEIQKALSLSQPALSKAIDRGEKDFTDNPIKL